MKVCERRWASRRRALSQIAVPLLPVPVPTGVPRDQDLPLRKVRRTTSNKESSSFDSFETAFKVGVAGDFHSVAGLPEVVAAAPLVVGPLVEVASGVDPPLVKVDLAEEHRVEVASEVLVVGFPVAVAVVEFLAEGDSE
jgi:hypothetical protein